MAKIRHLAIWTDDPAELAAFYVETFGMTITEPLTSAPGSGRWVFLSDGIVRLALIAPENSGGVSGLHHFAFTAEADERGAILARLKARNIEPRQCDNPYLEDRVCDLDGNAIDLSGPDLTLRQRS